MRISYNAFWVILIPSGPPIAILSPSYLFPPNFEILFLSPFSPVSQLVCAWGLLWDEADLLGVTLKGNWLPCLQLSVPLSPQLVAGFDAHLLLLLLWLCLPGVCIGLVHAVTMTLSSHVQRPVCLENTFLWCYSYYRLLQPFHCNGCS